MDFLIVKIGPRSDSKNREDYKKILRKDLRGWPEGLTAEGPGNPLADFSVFRDGIFERLVFMGVLVDTVHPPWFNPPALYLFRPGICA